MRLQAAGGVQRLLVPELFPRLPAQGGLEGDERLGERPASHGCVAVDVVAGELTDHPAPRAIGASGLFVLWLSAGLTAAPAEESGERSQETTPARKKGKSVSATSW